MTDDPETPGPGGWEINIISSIETNRDATEMEVPLFDINYGIGEKGQFKIEFAVESNDPSDDEVHWGVGDLLIGYKHRFLEEADAGWAVSFYPQVSSPTGNEFVDIGSGSAEILIPFEFQKHFCEERGWINPEVGYDVVIEDDDANFWKFGVGAGWAISDKFEVMAEVGAFIFPQGAEPDDPFFNVGFERPLSKNVILLGSCGRSFREREDGTPDLIALLGIQLLFGSAVEDEETPEKEMGEEESTAMAHAHHSRMAHHHGHRML